MQLKLFALSIFYLTHELHNCIIFALSPLLGVVGIGQDITGRIAQEREYSKLIDSANAPIFGVDTLGKVTIWNKNAHKLVGYSSEEVMGQNLVEQFITPEHRARVQSVIDQALAGEETANFEFPLMTKAGIRLEVLLNATTRRDEQGNVIGKMHNYILSTLPSSL